MADQHDQIERLRGILMPMLDYFGMTSSIGTRDRTAKLRPCTLRLCTNLYKLISPPTAVTHAAADARNAESRPVRGGSEGLWRLRAPIDRFSCIDRANKSRTRLGRAPK